MSQWINEWRSAGTLPAKIHSCMQEKLGCTQTVRDQAWDAHLSPTGWKCALGQKLCHVKVRALEQDLGLCRGSGRAPPLLCNDSRHQLAVRLKLKTLQHLHGDRASLRSGAGSQRKGHMVMVLQVTVTVTVTMTVTIARIVTMTVTTTASVKVNMTVTMTVSDRDSNHDSNSNHNSSNDVNKNNNTKSNSNNDSAYDLFAANPATACCCWNSP